MTPTFTEAKKQIDSYKAQLARRLEANAKRRAMLGPMKPLNQRVIIQIELSQNGQDIIAMGYRRVSKTNILKLIRQYIYYPLKAYMDSMIKERVPIDTGLLQRAMRHSIENRGGSETMDIEGPNGFMVVFNAADLDYASPVMRMPGMWIRHPGIHKKHELYSRKTGKLLNDPKAWKGSFGWITNKGRAQAKALFSSFISGPMSFAVSKIAEGFNIPPETLARTLFTVRYK